MAASRVRLARKVLAALEGQPSECETCGGWGKPSDETMAEWERRGFPADMAMMLAPCGDCRGTGHNLRGYLPRPPDWPDHRMLWDPMARRRREMHEQILRGHVDAPLATIGRPALRVTRGAIEAARAATDDYARAVRERQLRGVFIHEDPPPLRPEPDV